MFGLLCVRVLASLLSFVSPFCGFACCMLVLLVLACVFCAARHVAVIAIGLCVCDCFLVCVCCVVLFVCVCAVASLLFVSPLCYFV